MSKLFLHLLNISITAGWIVLVVVLLRFVLKKAPKWIRVVLWGLVALRLMLPVSIESVTSLVPSAETVKIESVTAPVLTSVNEYNGVSYFYENVRGEQIVLQSGFSALNSAVNPTPAKAAEHFDTVAMLKTVAGWVWLAGVCGMLLYALISFLRLRHRVRTSVALEKGVYVCDEISDPFILGLIVSKIYLPSGMDEQTRAYVLSHERAHLRRFDFIWKPLGFFLLSIYWFNPLLWLAYLLLCRDIELACDEKVVKELDDAGKAAYSEALVHASVSRRMVSACPLAFGETGVKGRVKSVLNYKKPAFWIILVAILACVAVAVCFLTMPKKKDKPNEDAALPTAVPETVWGSDAKVLQWLDYFYSSDMPWNNQKEITLDAYPGVTFRWAAGSVEAIENGRTRTLFTGMPVWNVFFADVTGDGKPELCASVSYGSGIVDEHIIVYDYANRQAYTLWSRGEFDYHLSAVDGKLQVNKRPYNNSTAPLLDIGTLEMHNGVPCCLWQSDVSYTALLPELHESELTGEWLVEEEKDNDGNVLYTFAFEDLWKEYRFEPDGTVVYNETVPISSDYEKAFGHPVEYAYEVYDDHVFIKGERSINGYLDPLTGNLKLSYQPSPGQYVYQTLRRMGEDLPETDAQASPAPVSDTTSPFDQSQYHKTVPVGEVPEALRSVVARDLFCAGYLNGGKLIPYEDRVLSYWEATDGDTTAAIFDLYDLYGNLLTHAEVILDPYQTVESAEATADGGIVFASGFYEVQLSDRSWASEHTDVVSYIVKLDASGRQLWKTALPNVNGYALHLCIENNDAYYFFGNWETPETRRPGRSSYTDLYLLKIGTDGSILKEQTYGGSDFDMLWTVDICAEGFVMDALIQSTDGDFPADSAWRIVVDPDLMIVEKQQIAVPRLADYVGTVDGKRFYDDDLRFNFYPDGYVHAILDYGTFYLIVSENNTGVYDSQPLFINSIWYLTETVYVAYDKQNNLLWKAAVDSSPDYDSMVKQYTSDDRP